MRLGVILRAQAAAGVGGLWRTTEIWSVTARYEATRLQGSLEQARLRFSGLSPDGVLPEMVEYETIPWLSECNSIPN